jgi:hypothetical protein
MNYFSGRGPNKWVACECGLHLHSLTKYDTVIVSPSDLSRVDKTRWVSKRNSIRASKTNESIHRRIMQPPDGVIIDHKNGYFGDNRRENLRTCTYSENNRNRRSVGGKSKYKGVCWVRDHGKWKAAIRPGKQIFLGYFESEVDAAIAYDKAAIKHFGQFARTNF